MITDTVPADVLTRFKAATSLIEIEQLIFDMPAESNLHGFVTLACSHIWPQLLECLILADLRRRLGRTDGLTPAGLRFFHTMCCRDLLGYVTTKTAQTPAGLFWRQIDAELMLLCHEPLPLLVYESGPEQSHLNWIRKCVTEKL